MLGNVRIRIKALLIIVVLRVIAVGTMAYLANSAAHLDR